MKSLNILIIAEGLDQTAAFFAKYLHTNHILYRLVEWHDIFRNLSLIIEYLESARDTFNGVYVREPAIGNIQQISFIEAVYCALAAHPNVVGPSPYSTNWSKQLHNKSLELSIKSCAPKNAFFPRTISGFNLPQHFEQEIIKPISSMRGHTRIRNATQNYEYGSGPSAPIPFIVQEEIDGLEIRVHIIDGEVHSVIVHHERQNYKFKDGGNYHCEPYKISEELKRELMIMAHHEKSRFCGIDILIDKFNKAWILEVNPMPGFHTFDEKRLDGLQPLCEALHSSLKSLLPGAIPNSYHTQCEQ